MTDPGGGLTLDEVADRLGLHYMTVYRYVRTGRLPASRVGRTWSVDPADVDALARQEPAATAGTRRSAGSAGSAAGRLEQRLLAGDEAGAWSVVEEALVGGLDAERVLVEVVAAALRAVGERWHRGEASVADEHRATAVATRVIARLGPRFAHRGPARGTVVLGTPAGDHHALPTAILRDLLRSRRFEVVDLGADVPAESWAEAVAHPGTGSPLVAVGIAASTPGLGVTLGRAVAAIRSAAPVPILLGGSAAAAHRRVAGRVDATTSSALDAVDTIERWADPTRP
jgi:excisionase family DNA binding protein